MKTPRLDSSLAIAVLGLLASGGAIAETKVDLRGGLGYDSNVFDLNPVIGERDGFFAEAEATVEAIGTTTKGSVRKADIGVSGQLFESAVGDGDHERFYVRVRGDSAEKYDENGWEWALRYQLRDQTYVSRLTGLVAVDTAGNDIGDRYDSGAGDLKAQWRLPGWKGGRVSLEATAADRNYRKDYQQSGLDRLDYRQYGVGPGYEIGPVDNRFRVQLKAEERVYEDRRVSDATGNPVAGTDLEYRYYSAEARYRRRLSKKTAVALTGGYEVREDNGVGFADRTEWSAGIEWNLQFADDSRLSLEGQYSSRVFDQQVTADPTINDEAPEKKGFDARIRYSRPLPFLDIRGFSLVADVAWESFDNSSDLRYEYDRLTGFVGVRQQF